MKEVAKEVIVVQTLQNQNGICKAEVERKSDDRRDQLSPDGADQVGQITYEPDSQESQG